MENKEYLLFVLHVVILCLMFYWLCDEIITRICFTFSDPRMLETTLCNDPFTFKDSKPKSFQKLQSLGHLVVPTFERKLRPCAFCTMCKIKTKSGWRVYTRYKCAGCDVPLCTKHRDCFLLYHTTLLYDLESRHLSEHAHTT